MTPCSDAVGYKRFGLPCCLHLRGEVEVFWVVTRVVILLRHQHFGGLRCLHLQGEVKAAWSSEMSTSYHIKTRCHNPQDHDMNRACWCSDNARLAFGKRLVRISTGFPDPYLRAFVVLLSLFTPLIQQALPKSVTLPLK
jgi:hypothetical protein